jgi:hypothetical protein
MASADGGASVLVCVALALQGPLFCIATQLPTDPLVPLAIIDANWYIRNKTKEVLG